QRVICNRPPPAPQAGIHAHHRASGSGPVRVLAEASEFLQFYDRDTPAVIQSRPSPHPMDHGSAAVEASIILSALLLLIVGSIEFGRVLCMENTMLLAVQEAGRFAMISNDAPLMSCDGQAQTPSCPAPSN